MKSKKKYLFLLAFLFCVNVFAETENVTIINIESAEKSEYKKNDNGDQEEIILKGSVSISVTKGSTKISIKSDLVTYNRETQILFAQGNVVVKQTEAKAGEQNVTADTLLLNTSTLEGIFDNGRVMQTQSDAINLPSGSTLIVASEIFGRDSSGTISFKNANLTFCDNENPHWRIKSSKVWLLPGGEFAFLNALLFVGNIPILYLPAFYYPKDELIFNPSFGFAERKGYYLQTTVYLLGRKGEVTTATSAAEGDDIAAGVFSFMKGAGLKKQVREGLVLHNTEEDYTGDTTNYLKMMADYYSNLGFMFGADGVYKNSKNGFNISGNAEIGLSNTVYYNSTLGKYVPYDYYGNVNQDSSNFLGLQLPFRYGFDLKLSISKPFSYTLSLPIYSDPYFSDDFGTRSESLDWIGFFIDNATDDTTTTTVSSFTWNSAFSYSFKIPQFLNPVVTDFSVSNISSNVTFSSKQNSSANAYSPQRGFFYPSQVVPIQASASISGTIIDIGSSKNKKSTKKDVEYTIPLIVPEEFKDKKVSETNSNSTSTTETVITETVTTQDNSDNLLDEITLPKLTNSEKTTITDITGFTMKLTYSITPTFTSQLSYDSSILTKPEDFDFSRIYSTYYQVTSPFVLTNKMSYSNDFVSMNNTVTFSPVFQDHPIYSGTSDSDSVKKADYTAHKLDVTSTNSVNFNPFVYTKMFKNTGLSWNTTVKVIKTEFLNDIDNPAWNYAFVDFTDDDFVTTNSLSANLYASEGKFSQQLTLSSTLPPKNQAYDAVLKLVFPYVTVNFGSGVDEQSDGTWQLDPLSQSVSFSCLNSKLSISESFNYNLQNNYAESAKFALTFYGFQLSYIMQYTNGFTLDPSSVFPKWNSNSYKEFLPHSLNLVYATSGKTYRWWKNRIVFTPSVDTRIVCDLLKPTSSYFKFTPGITFKIHNFLDLTFSSESRNNVIYRYVQNYIPDGPQIGGETNPVIDLYNSFKFWDDNNFYDPNQTARKGTGYKLKNLSISLTHKACDWDFTSELTFKPRLVYDGPHPEYKYDPYFTVAISWKPLPSVKAKVLDEYGEWQLNP